MILRALSLVGVVFLVFAPVSALASCGQEREAGMTRDDVYRSVLEKLDDLEKAFREGPEDAETSRFLTELQKRLSQMETRKAEGASTKKQTVAPPQGPFPPSQQPSPESEQEKRRRATEERFLSGGPLEKETASLEGVPEEWIQSSRETAQAEMARLDGLLKKAPLDRKAAEASLAKLSSALRGMSKPPLR